jgi:hypothetical protein
MLRTPSKYCVNVDFLRLGSVDRQEVKLTLFVSFFVDHDIEH